MLQVKYVVELARALAQHPAVYRVELMTRLIQDPAVDDSYAVPSEVLWRPPGEDDTGLGGAHLIRLPCGPSDTYLRCALPACACRGPGKCLQGGAMSRDIKSLVRSVTQSNAPNGSLSIVH